MNDLTEVLGTVAMVPKGEYDSTAYYEYLNVVEYEGSTYMAKKNVNNVLPTDEEYWQFIAGGVTKEDTAIVFDTVADMKASEILKDGMTVHTLGYYSVNDGGGATYKITDTESQSEYQEELESGLYATLIVDDVVYPEQFGAYGDGTHDDTNAIQLSLNQKANTIVFNKNYLIVGKSAYRTTISIPSNKRLIFYGLLYFSSEALAASLFKLYEVENITIENAKIIFNNLGAYGNANTHAFYLRRTKRCKFYNINLENIYGDGFFITDTSPDSETSTEYNENLLLDNITIDGKNVGRNGITIQCCSDSKITNVYCKNINGYDPKCAIDLEIEKSTSTILNLTIDSVYAENCRKAVAVQGNSVESTIKANINNIISNEIVPFSISGLFSSTNPTNITINNIICNDFDKDDISSPPIYFDSTYSVLNIKSITFNNCDINQACYITTKTGSYVNIDNIINSNSVFTYLYAIAEGSGNVIPTSETIIHYNLFGLDYVDNFVQRKGLVKWINDFTCIYDYGNSNYSVVYAPKLKLVSAFGFVNPKNWGNCTVTFIVDTGGSITTDNNVTAQTLNTKGSQATVTFEGNSDLTSVTKVWTNVFKAQ